MLAADDPASKQSHHSSTAAAPALENIRSKKTPKRTLCETLPECFSTPATALTFTFTVKLKLFNTSSAWLPFHHPIPPKASGLLFHHYVHIICSYEGLIDAVLSHSIFTGLFNSVVQCPFVIFVLFDFKFTFL